MTEITANDKEIAIVVPRFKRICYLTQAVDIQSADDDGHNRTGGLQPHLKQGELHFQAMLLRMGLGYIA